MIVGFTASCFDLLHAGHVLMLEEARLQCDHLIAALQVDPTIDRPNKNKPTQSLYERFVQLKACRWVDEIIPYATEQELEDILLTRKIDIRFIGEDYINQDFTGKGICLARGITIFYNSRQHSYSTTELKKRIKESN